MALSPLLFGQLVADGWLDLTDAEYRSRFARTHHEIDAPVRALVVTLNETCGLRTYSSCGGGDGHLKPPGEWFIFLALRDSDVLPATLMEWEATGRLALTVVPDFPVHNGFHTLLIEGRAGAAADLASAIEHE